MKNFRQNQTLSTCRYGQSTESVAAFIQTLLCDHWLGSCLACFMPFKQSHIYIPHLGGPGWITIMLLFFSVLYVKIWLCMAQNFGLAQTRIKLITFLRCRLKPFSDVWSSRLWQITSYVQSLTTRYWPTKSRKLNLMPPAEAITVIT